MTVFGIDPVQMTGWVIQAVITGVSVGVTNYIANRWVVRHMEKIEGRVARALRRRAA